MRLYRPRTGETFVLNDRPNEAPGPDDAEWQPLLGEYEVIQWGMIAQRRKIHVHNGYLYLDNLKLEELSNGLFASCTGQILDMTAVKGADATFDNVPMRRAQSPADQS
jgi:hypothetical protein